MNGLISIVIQLEGFKGEKVLTNRMTLVLVNILLFASEGHSFEDDAGLYILEKGEWVNAEERRCKESFYICKFSTLEPTGMNKKAGSMADLYEKVHGRI